MGRPTKAAFSTLICLCSKTERLLDEVMRLIQQDKVNAEYAFHLVAERYRHDSGGYRG